MKVGLLGAMLEEVAAIKQLMVIYCETELGGRVYIEGQLNAIDVVLTFSRWGKVASSCTVATLIHKFNVDRIVFTGVAGAVHPHLNVGDIVIGDGYYQHDMDATPLFAKYQIPLTENILFEPSENLVSFATAAAERFIDNLSQLISAELLLNYSIRQPTVYRGVIASGD